MARPIEPDRDARPAPLAAARATPAAGIALSIAFHGLIAGALAATWASAPPAEDAPPPIAVEVVISPAVLVAADLPLPKPAPAAAEAPHAEPSAQEVMPEPQVAPPPTADASEPSPTVPAPEPPTETATATPTPVETPTPPVAPRDKAARRPAARAPSPATLDTPPTETATPSPVVTSIVTPVVQAALPAPVAPAPAANEHAVYLGRLLAWLERHKEYPRVARENGIEGETIVRFRIDRSGAVVAHAIDRSSGHGVLDRAVLRLIERANPVPAPPDTLSGLDFSVPIRFGLR